MKNRGFKEVYQLDGGIQTYGQTYGDGGLWQGALYVFDNRLSVKFSGIPSPVSSCGYPGLSGADKHHMLDQHSET